jgi:hypothetical protein
MAGRLGASPASNNTAAIQMWRRTTGAALNRNLTTFFGRIPSACSARVGAPRERRRPYLRDLPAE